MTLNQEALSTSSTGISSRDQLKASIDEIIASECVYCGDSMIKYDTATLFLINYVVFMCIVL